MKLIFFAALLSLLLAGKCNKDEKTPDCVTQRIEQIKTQPKWNPPAEVNQYSYKGRNVYLFNSPCCDQYNELIDANCNSICAPSGGITGKGDGKCADFSSTAIHVRLVWKDDR
ncbi:MAG TPA: hypothetical protein VMZ03_07100 [Chitinophagaceae bacterium]|nr:hypothetical protein [Chitinophagaceae bacterium]